MARCSSCANSTCNLPSWLFARWAKMSKIRLFRSITRHSRVRSKLRCWAGERAWLKITTDASCAVRSRPISSTLPLPANKAASGRWRLPNTTPRTSTPAPRTNSTHSATLSAKSGSPKSRQTTIALSPKSGRSNTITPLSSQLNRRDVRHPHCLLVPRVESTLGEMARPLKWRVCKPSG